MAILDFTALKKEYMTVKLPDKKNTVVFVDTPTKTLAQELVKVDVIINDPKATEEEVSNVMYTIAAKLMSRNRDEVVITKKQLESCLSYDDVALFITEYTKYVKNTMNINAKN